MSQAKYRATRVIGLLLILTLAVPLGVATADLPGGSASGWVTNFQLQNAGSGDASITLDGYATDGSLSAGMVVTTVVQNGSVTLLGDNFVGSGYQGAGIVSSSQPMFGIMFVTNRGRGSLGAANTASAIMRTVNSEDTDTTLFFPLAKQDFGSGHKTTTFYVQNAGSADTNITVTFTVSSLISPVTCTQNPKNINVKKGTQANFTLADLGCPASGVLGSIKVTSDQNLAGIYMEHDAVAPGTGVKVLQGTNGFTPADAGNVLIAPIIKRNFGANRNRTGMQIQNVGNTDILAGQLVISYTVASSSAGASVGQVLTETNPSTIPSGGTYTSAHAVLPISGTDGESGSGGTLASAYVYTVDTNARIVAIVNENRPRTGPFSGTPRETTYGAFAAQQATTKANLPLVKEYFGSQGGRCTGVQVATSGGDAIIKLTFTSGATVISATTDTAVPVKTFLRLSDNATAGVTLSGGVAGDLRSKNFSVVAESLTPGVSIVAIANESFCPNSARDEDDANYEGFNQ